MKHWKQLATGALVLVLAIVPALVSTQTTKSITISSKLTPAKDARVQVSTAIIPAAWPRPLTWSVTLGGVPRGTRTEMGAGPFVLVDTIRDVFTDERRYRVAVYSATKKDSVVRSMLVTRVAAPVTVVLTKGMTVSSKLTPDGESRIIATTAVIPSAWARPIRWSVSLNGQLRGEAVDSGTAPYVLLDTVRDVIATEQRYRVVAYSGTKRDSVYKSMLITRPPTAKDLAFVDSFPATKRCITVCGGYGFRRAAASDTVGPWVDSLPWSRDTSGTLVLLVGYTYPMGFFGKNRYTGAVVQFVDGLSNTDPRCEATRLAWEAEKSASHPGFTPARWGSTLRVERASLGGVSPMVTVWRSPSDTVTLRGSSGGSVPHITQTSRGALSVTSAMVGDPFKVLKKP